MPWFYDLLDQQRVGTVIRCRICGAEHPLALDLHVVSPAGHQISVILRGMRTTLENVAEDGRHSELSGPIYHRGWEFTAPFYCCNCGGPISARQFAFARMCGHCDIGRGPQQRHGYFFAGPHRLANHNDSHFIDVTFLNPPQTPLERTVPRHPQYRPHGHYMAPRRWPHLPTVKR